MQKKGCHSWLRVGEKRMPNGLTDKTELSVQLRYYDESSPTKDRELEESINPADLMNQYYDMAVLYQMAHNILGKCMQENFSNMTYDKLPGHVRIIYSFPPDKKKYKLEDIITARVAFDARNIIDTDESKWDIAPQPIYRFVKKTNEKTAFFQDKNGNEVSFAYNPKHKVTSNKLSKAISAHFKDLFSKHL